MPENESLEDLYRRFIAGQLSKEEEAAQQAPLQAFAARVRQEQMDAARAALIEAGSASPERPVGQANIQLLVLRFGGAMQGMHSLSEIVVGVGHSREVERWTRILELVRQTYTRMPFGGMSSNSLEREDPPRPQIRYYDPTTEGEGFIFADVLMAVAAIEVRPWRKA